MLKIKGFSNRNGVKPNWIIQVKCLVLTSKSHEWCKLPYPNHPKGCPNYGKSFRCPPQAPNIESFINVNKPIYLVYSEFDLLSHVGFMKEKHPEWSDLQCKCVLYWQSKSRKQMNTRVKEAIKILGTNRVTSCPEAMGVNVFATARKSGLILDKTKNIKICRHISLLGFK